MFVGIIWLCWWLDYSLYASPIYNMGPIGPMLAMGPNWSHLQHGTSNYPIIQSIPIVVDVLAPQRALRPDCDMHSHALDVFEIGRA